MINPPDSLEAITKLIEALKSQPDSAVQAARITVYGMLGVALVTSFSQFLANYFLFRNELRKIKTQNLTELRSKQLSAWRSDILDGISKILSLTDPEVSNQVDKKLLIPLIHRTQLQLNLENNEESKVNGALNRLALMSTGWENADEAERLRALDGLTQATQAMFREKDKLWIEG